MGRCQQVKNIISNEYLFTAWGQPRIVSIAVTVLGSTFYAILPLMWSQVQEKEEQTNLQINTMFEWTANISPDNII